MPILSKEGIAVDPMYENGAKNEKENRPAVFSMPFTINGGVLAGMIPEVLVLKRTVI